MLRLRGLFNSAYRLSKAHVSAMLLRLRFGGSVGADRGLFLQPTSTRLRPSLRLNSKFDVCIFGQFVLVDATKKPQKRNYFPSRPLRSLINLLCYKPLLTVTSGARHGQNVKNVCLRLGSNLSCLHNIEYTHKHTHKLFSCDGSILEVLYYHYVSHFLLLGLFK